MRHFARADCLLSVTDSCQCLVMSGQVITIAQQKGGSGKTTLTANLAVAALQLGKRVAVIDSDPQGSLGHWAMARFENATPDLKFATASAWGVAFECGQLQSEYDLVLVDTPPKIDADLRPALRASDLVLVPVSASQVDLWATDGVLELARREGRPVLTVMNRAKRNTRVAAEIAAQLSGMDVEMATTVMANRVLYAETMGQGRSVLEVQKTGPAALEFKALAAEVFGLCELTGAEDTSDMVTRCAPKDFGDSTQKRSA